MSWFVFLTFNLLLPFLPFLFANTADDIQFHRRHIFRAKQAVKKMVMVMVMGV